MNPSRRLLPQMQTIAQMGGPNNHFADPGQVPRLAQQTPEELLQQQAMQAGGQVLQDIPRQQPYVAPDYSQAANSLPTYGQGGMIGPNPGYSDPNDPSSTAYALTQGINHLATGSLSARQNQKFQRGQAASDLVRNFLAPLAATFGPNGAAQGVKDYMKTSAERATKAKEMKLKEQADSITQMKTMADMLSKNTPYTKDSLELIIKRATAEQQIKNQMVQASANEQRARASNMQQADYAAGAAKKVSDIVTGGTKQGLNEQKTEHEALKGQKTAAHTETEGEKKNTQAATTGLRKEQAALAANKSAQVVQKTKDGVSESAATVQQKQASAAHQTALEKLAIAKAEAAGKYHPGPADAKDEFSVLKEVAPGQAGKFQQIVDYWKQKQGHVTLEQLYTAKNAVAGVHEKEKAEAKGKGGKRQPPPAPTAKY